MLTRIGHRPRKALTFRSCFFLVFLAAASLGACEDAGDQSDTISLPATLSVEGNGMFSHTEVDYKSVLPGLDIVRANPMNTRRGGFRDSFLSAGYSGWHWMFETRLSNPWNLTAFTSTYQHLGSIQALRFRQPSGTNNNPENYARGLFYDLSFGPSGSSATLVNLETDETSIFQSVNSTTMGGVSYERLAERRLRDGTRIVYSYEDSGFGTDCAHVRIRHVASGASLYVRRTALNQRQDCLPQDITLPDGTSKIRYHWKYTDYNYPELVQVTYPNGSTRKYGYKKVVTPLDEYGYRDTVSGLALVVDEEGRREMNYDWEGEKIVRRYSGPTSSPQEVLHVRDNADGSRTVTDGEGTTRTLTFTRWVNAVGVGFMRFAGMSSYCEWCPNDAKSVQYNDIGLPKQITSQRGVVTKIERKASDPMQREEKRIVGAGTGAAKTITTSYDSRFNLPTQTSVTDASGSRVTTEVRYDAQARPTQVKVTHVTKNLSGGSSSTTQTTNLSYVLHPNGQVKTMTIDGPRSDIDDRVVYGYHPWGILEYTKNALGTTRYDQLDGLGRARRIVHPNGTTTQLTYDWEGRVLSTTTAGVATRFTYYKNGLLKSETTPGTNEELTYTYDSAGRLQTMTDGLGNRREFSYDALGRPVLAREGNINQGTLSRSYSTRYGGYSASGRTITTFPTDFPGHKQVSTYNQDSDLVSTTDALSKKILLQLDALGRVTKTSNTANSLSNVSTFDVADNVRQSIYAGSEGTARKQSFRYVSDGTGAVWQSADADTGTDNFVRDDAGNVVDYSNSYGGNRVLSRFDALNRPTRTAFIDPQSGKELAVVNYAYDKNPDGSGPAPNGRLTKATGTFGSAEFFYDARGNLTQKRQSYDSAQFSESYEYDAGGRLQTMTYPSGRQVHVKFNAVGQPTALYTRKSANDNWALVADQISYAPFADRGDAKSLRFGGRFVAKRLRDTAGRVISYSDGNETVSVEYRADGRVSKLVSGKSTLASYTYDASNHLAQATGVGFGSETFSFESTGDLVSVTTGGATIPLRYQDNTSRLTKVGDGNVAHSHRGVVRTGGGLTLSYDARGQLATATNADGAQAHYSYDALGQRQSKTVSGQTTVYHYDAAGRLTSELNAQTQQIEREYVWLGDRPVMMIVPARGNRPESRYFIYTDYSNTPVRLTDTAGNTVWRWQRNPFGSNAPSVASIEFNLRMPGQYFDKETGLHYNGARYYVPIIGRYLQPDPLGEAAGMSAYTYANGDPVNRIDPTGLESGIVVLPPITVTPGGAFWGGGYTVQVTTGGLGSVSNWNTANPDSPYGGAHTDASVVSQTNTKISVFDDPRFAAAHINRDDFAEIAGAIGAIHPVGRVVTAIQSVVGRLTVTRHGRKHFSVRVMGSDGRGIRTDRIILEDLGGITEVLRARKDTWESGVSKSRTVRVPNAQNGLARQRRDLSEPLDLDAVYHRETNSCVSHVCDVMRASGVKNVPEKKGSGQLRFLFDFLNGK